MGSEMEDIEERAYATEMMLTELREELHKMESDWRLPPDARNKIRLYNYYLARQEQLENDLVRMQLGGLDEA